MFSENLAKNAEITSFGIFLETIQIVRDKLLIENKTEPVRVHSFARRFV